MTFARDGGRRRLCLVVNRPAFFLSHRLPLALAARDAGLEVVIATPSGEGVEEIRAQGLEWCPLPLSRKGMGPLGELQTLLGLVALYRELKPDIVHHVTIKPVLYGTAAAAICGVPAVVNAISGLGFLFTSDRWALGVLGRQLYRLLMRHRRMEIIVQNREDRDFFIERRLAKPDILHLVPGSGVDVSAFHPRRRIGSQPPAVLQSSRMLADKGVREFIAAARIVKASRPEVRFVLVGDVDDGNPTSLRKAELEAAQAEKVIEWWGYRRDVAEALAAADIYCLPSYREGLPKSLAEAAAFGLPLVTTDTSGCRQIVDHEVNGLLVPVADSEALAAAVLRLLEEPALAERLGKAARLKAEGELSLQSVVAAQLAIYDSLLRPTEIRAATR